MDDFLAKPVQLDQLDGKLEHHLRKPILLPAQLSTPPADREPDIRINSSEHRPPWVGELIAVCHEDLARLDALPSSDVAARRALLHRMEGALALVMPIPAGDPLDVDARELGSREYWVRGQLRELEASTGAGKGHSPLSEPSEA